MNLIDREKQIPEEFKDLAKEFAEKGFITTSVDMILKDLVRHLEHHLGNQML